jgi:cytosine/adenosine deaminase-related metal-dependent hydrolase
MSLILKNISWVSDEESITSDIRIEGDKIIEIGNLHPGKKDVAIDFSGHYVYPGLINSHDHLELNLYPALGSPYYSNYVEWSNAIYKPLESPLREIEKVNMSDRLMWGGLKNLISGATTVIHHNPWNRLFEKKEFPVKVLKQMSWSHSLAFGKSIAESFPKKRNIPFVIHAAEGIDETALSEIDTLEKLGLLHDNTVLIHCVALNSKTIELIARRNASVIWCPASNNFIFGKTTPVEKIKGSVRLAIGTDSTLTGSPTLLDEIRSASDQKILSEKDLVAMVTTQPSAIFQLPVPEIALNGQADLFITPKNDNDYYENLTIAKPSDIRMVLVNGNVRMQDYSIEAIHKSMKHFFSMSGITKRTDVDVASLKQRIERIVIKNDLEKNPLWNLIQV